MSSSIGYGDFSPSTQGGRAFFCVWAIVGAGTLTVLFSSAFDRSRCRSLSRAVLTLEPRPQSSPTPTPLASVRPSPPLCAPTQLASTHQRPAEETFQRSRVNRLWIRLTHPSHKIADELAREESQGFPRAPTTRPSTPTSSRPADGPGKDYPELAPAPSSSTATKGADGLTDLSSQDKMLELLRLTRQHLDRLILADGDEKDEHLDRVVRKVMGAFSSPSLSCSSATGTRADAVPHADDEGFSRRNREHVENDNGFKEFLCRSPVSRSFLLVLELAS